MTTWILRRFFAAVITIVALRGAAFGQVNYRPPSYVTPVTYGSTPNAAWTTSDTVSYASESDSLAERVADLEATIKSMKEREEAAKKKAAGKPTIKLGGRLHWDCAVFDQDAISLLQGRQRDGCEFRRVRLNAHGEMFNVFDYKIQIDFAPTDTISHLTYEKKVQVCEFKDVYMTIRELPYVGHIRIGHFKEPFSLEELTSCNDIDFMERSTSNNAFAPSRNTGIMFRNALFDERFTWAIGGFVANNSAKPPIFQSEHGGLALTGRITSLLWYDESAPDRGLWHVGAAYSYRDMDEYETQFKARPECHLAGYVVDTGTIHDVADVQLVNFETAYVWGPVFAQAEWFGAHVDQTTGATPFFNGCYATVGWFLTGEHRKYKKGSGVFTTVTPNENFFRVRAQGGSICTGMGAWELLYRYSYLDLTNISIDGGLISDHTIGLNWYLNPHMRIMFNYVNSTVTDTVGEGNMNIFETRAQVNF
ncbi:MAG: porin [Planctomycetia bacterium]|jgi:phosphate-selective porin OprO/OprP